MADEIITIDYYGPVRELKVKDLLSTHKDYKSNAKEWTFLQALYDGIREVIRLKLVPKHEREPLVSFRSRMDKLFGFGYSKSVADIFHFYLFKNDSSKKIGPLSDNKLFSEFLADADLYGNSYDSAIMDIALYAIIQGHIGILVDKSPVTFPNLESQINARVYPYISKYFPKAILDWAYDRDIYSRPYLSYLKLVDDNGQYRIFTPSSWEIWSLPIDEKGNVNNDENASAVFLAAGENTLGEIPFIWHYNLRSKTRGIGISDIHEVSRIDLSIIRNLSQIEQIIDFAAFPMMRKPMREAKPIASDTPQQQDEVGVEAILEFDPENPNSKPDWLEARVLEPIRATIDVVEKKISEIYRASNIGGMSATEPSSTVQSGVAKKIDFQMLNSKLVNKAINLEATENKILEYWLKYENLWEASKDNVKITRKRQYDIDTVTQDLGNALTSKSIVISSKFNELLQKQTARQILPAAGEKELSEIDMQIEENVGKISNAGKIILDDEENFNDYIDSEPEVKTDQTTAPEQTDIAPENNQTSTTGIGKATSDQQTFDQDMKAMAN